MSHFTRVRTQVTQKPVLLRALTALGYQTATATALTPRPRLEGYGGQSRQVDIVVRVPGGRGVGFLQPAPDQPFELVADWMVAGVEEQAFRRRVEQEYAAQVAEDAARAAGWQDLVRTAQPDGTIVITGARC